MCMKGLSSPINFIDHKEAVLLTGNALSDRIQFGRYRSVRVGKVCVFTFAHTFCVQMNSNLASIQALLLEVVCIIHPKDILEMRSPHT